MRNNFGFTLIEILIVVVLMGIMGTIITQVFILGLQSQGKTETIKEVKQSGDFALSVMESMIRNALVLQAEGSQCNTNVKQITILNVDGLTTTFDCSSDSLASVSGVFVPDGQPAPTGIPLISDKVKIETSSCNFRVVCPDPPVKPKYVYISFTLSQKNNPQVTETAINRASIDYQTTVSLRNYD